MISLTLDIEPVAWARTRISRSGHFITAPKMRAFQAHVRALIHGSVPMVGPLKLIVRFYMKPPMRKVRELPDVKPDLSNLVKNIEDAANGMLWGDDAQIVKIEAEKWYDFASKKGRIEIEVQQIITPKGNK